MKFERSAHLTILIADSERLAARLAAHPIDAEVLAAAREADLLASLQLDGSTIPAEGGWAGAIRSRAEAGDDLAASDDALWRAELSGLAAATGLEDVAEGLRADPAATLARLHAVVTNGLVSDDRRSAYRADDRTVTDASVGRIIYWPTKPGDISLEMAELTAWLVGPGSREHALVRAGWVLLHVLRIQPFGAANGRVARTAARALLADGGLDPHGAAPLAGAQAQDAIGLVDEVARTIRRRDATVFLERWGESVTTALRAAARTHANQEAVDEAASERLATLPDAFTITDWREVAGATADEALRDLLDAGLVALVPGARGLRLTQRHDD